MPSATTCAIKLSKYIERNKNNLEYEKPGIRPTVPVLAERIVSGIVRPCPSIDEVDE